MPELARHMENCKKKHLYEWHYIHFFITLIPYLLSSIQMIAFFIEIRGSWAIQHNSNILKQTPFEIDKSPILSISPILQVYPLLQVLRNFQPESRA